MYPTLMSVMWKRERNGAVEVDECGLVFRLSLSLPQTQDG
jgi:hypothetical protein